MNGKPRIAHVLYRLDTGGMEQIIVTLINQTSHRYRHAVICLEGFTDFRERIEAADVSCVALNKNPGKDWGCYLRLWHTLRRLRPDLVQTYNLGAIDAAPIARLAGAQRVVHAEHGRDAADPRGESRKYRYLRRGLSPFIDRFVVVSQELEDWLIGKVGIHRPQVVYIANGIDITGITPSSSGKDHRPLLEAFAPPGTLLIGTVGRLDPVKDHLGLLSAFDRLGDWLPAERDRLRLAIIGEGKQRAELETQIKRLGLTGRVCLLGNRSDVASLLAEFDIFALSSVAEGMPVTLLEAMAAGLPVVATAVGGVGEVVLPGETGRLVAAGDPHAFAKALAGYVLDTVLRGRHGMAGRHRVASQFSLSAMLSAYTTLYDGLLNGRGHLPQNVADTSVTGRKVH